MAITAKVNTPPDANGKVTNSSASKTVGTQNASKVLDNFTIKASDIPITLDNSSAANVRDALNESVLITTTQTLTNKTLTSPVINTGISGTAILDEDNMASNSNTKLATQQSIKSYVDTSVNTELVQDIVGAMFTSNTETNIDVEYQDGDGTIDLVATGSIDLTGTIAGNDFARFTDTNTLQGLSVAETKSALGISDNEIIDWTSDQGSTNIHAGNYTDTNTTYSVQDGELSQNNFTNADHTKLNSIEASADITDTANVTSVGALMDSEVTNLAQVKAFDSSDYLASSVTTISGGQASAITANTAKTGITSGQASAIIANTAKISYNSTASNKLGTIEENADVTDTANVTSSGALMDSELTSIANVKALNQSVISGASPTFGTANMSDASNKRLMTNAQETKLDSVETDADVTDTANVTSSGALMDSELAGIAAIKATTGTFLLADESKLDGIEASATADQSNSEIRALVESASDSNVFTDTDHSKLNAIAASANNYTLPLLDEDNMASDSATSVPSQQSVKAYVNSIVDSAPGTLDTLNELAAALGDNPNYATTTAADIATRAIKTNNLSDLANAGTARTNLGLGALAVLGTVNAATITDNSVGADELNVSGDGSSANFLRSDGDGTFTWATPTDTNTQLSTAQVQTIVGAMFSSNTETRIGVTYQSGDGTIDLVVDDMTANTNTQLSTEQVQDIAGPLVATNGTKTGIAVTYDDVNGDMDFVVDHDAATNFVANEHIDWTGASAGTIHASNYTNTGNTTYTAGTGLDLSGTTFNIAYSGFSAIQESAANDTFITFDTSGSNAIKIAELSDIIGLVNHDSITGFVANEHIDHTSVSITAGSGLAGGGTIAANRTLNIGAGTGILVHSDTIAVDHLPATDDRDVKPSAITTSGKYQVRAYFTSLEGLTGSAGSDWQDLLVLDTYSDGTGGDMNALAFDKSTQNIYHYLADQGASTWGTAKRLAYIENGSNNRVMTASSSSTVNGEGNLTFDGTDLKLLGDDLEMRWGTDGDFKIYVSSDDAYLKNVTQDKDIRFQVNDGGSNITAIKIDASDAGTAIFNQDIRLETNATYIHSTDASGNKPRMFGINGSNNTYIGPIDSYAGGLMLYGTSANLTGHIFYTGGTERWRITSSGTLQGNNKAITGIGGVYGNGGDLTLYNNTYNFKSATSADLMKLTTTGLGIGTTSPGAKLHIVHNGSAVVKAESTAGGYGAYSRLTTTTNAYDLVSLNGDFKIDESGVATRLTIKDSTGNVGIGQTSPGYKLDVNGDLRIVGNGDQMIRFTRSGADVVSIEQDSAQLYFYNRTTSKVMFLMSENGSAKLGYNSNPVLELRNTATGAGSGPSLTFGHSQGGNTSVGRIATYLTDGSQSGRAGHFRFFTTRGGTEELAMQLTSDKTLTLYQAGDAGDYMDLKVNDTHTEMHLGSGNYLKLSTDHGYLLLGPQNGSHCHFLSDIGNFYTTSFWYINNGVTLSSYNQDVEIRRNNSSADRFNISADYSRIIVNNAERFRATTTGATVTGNLTTTEHLVLPYGEINDAGTDVVVKATNAFVVQTGGANTRYNLTSSGVHNFYGNTSYSSPMSVQYGAIFNEGGHDSDTRIESDGNENMFRVDASTNRIGIGTGSPSYDLHVAGHAYASSSFLGPNGSVGTPSYRFHNDGNTGIFLKSANYMAFSADGYERFAANGNGLDLSGGTVNKIVHTAVGSRDKYRVWNSSYYCIGMDDAMTFGGLGSHAMTFQMNNEAARGFVWLDDNHSDAQGAMALTTNGKLTVAHSMRLGYGESDTTTPGAAYALDVYGGVVVDSASGTGMKITTQGNNWNMELVSADNGGSPAMSMGVRMQSFEGRANGHYHFDEDYSGQWFSGLRYAGNMTNWQVGYRSSSSDGNTPDYLDQARIMVDTNGHFHADGDVIAYSSTIGSDIKLKKNIKDINYGLKDVLNIRAVEFDWKEKREGKHDIGFIAQEIEKIIPEVVNEVTTIGENAKEGDTHKVVDYAKLTSVLMRAIQEQQVQIDELKTQIGEQNG